MIIIYLDDMETRHAIMDIQNDGRHKIIHTRTVQETVQAVIANPQADYLFLDHDLGNDPEKYMEDPGAEGTGSEVAELIAELPSEQLPKHVIIHTHNEPGAQYIYFILRKLIPVEWRPFGVNIEDILLQGENG